MVIMAWYDMIWYDIIILYVLNLNLTINFGHCSISALMPIFWATGNSADFFCRKWMTMYDGGAKCMFGSLGIWGNVPYDKPKLPWKFVFFILPETNPATCSTLKMDGWKMDPFRFGMANFQLLHWLKTSGHQLADSEEGTANLTFPTTEESNGKTHEPVVLELVEKDMVSSSSRGWHLKVASLKLEICTFFHARPGTLRCVISTQNKYRIWHPAIFVSKNCKRDYAPHKKKKEFETASAALRAWSWWGRWGVKKLQKSVAWKLASFLLRFFVWKFCEELKNPGAIQDTKELRVFFISR